MSLYWKIKDTLFTLVCCVLMIGFVLLLVGVMFLGPLVYWGACVWVLTHVAKFVWTGSW